ncbi:hypothetical protein [Virgibacillus proomii]|uniref:hypothetical protein n=1 Tax=Virgibacillus proomii TaxID=84407 RepID=UPI001C0F58B5|nr:hypothetical protein [Virgibacillus proomii]MBU5265390.1 hypothetical protein [Virgibacillus proomii]
MKKFKWEITTINVDSFGSIGQEGATAAIHRTQKKRFSFSRTEKLRQRYIARRKSDFLFQGQRSYGSNTSHAEKAIFFFKDREATAAIHRTQKKRFSFSRTRRSYGSNTSHAEKAIFFFKDKKELRQRHIAIFQGHGKLQQLHIVVFQECLRF